MQETGRCDSTTFYSPCPALHKSRNEESHGGTFWFRRTLARVIVCPSARPISLGLLAGFASSLGSVRKVGCRHPMRSFRPPKQQQQL